MPHPASPGQTPARREAILDVLRQIIDPASGRNIVEAGMVADLSVRSDSAAGGGEHVGFVLEVDPAGGRTSEPLRAAAEAALLALPGVSKATVVMTAERPSAQQRGAPEPAAPLATHVHKPAARGPGASVPATNTKQGHARISKIIAVASGKGGVGKSTVAVNLALGLKAMGANVGLLDADIYGPSVPRLLGLSGKPDARDNMLAPMDAFGLKAMSIGSIVQADQAMIWRGPMASSALTQMLTDVDWGPLDVLVIDMPPGTGDIQLTLAQRVPLAGAVIVSTPQDIALIDARKGIAMFGKTNVPILGLIENMSYYQCPKCGDTAHIFGHGGARETAAELGVPFLGEIPLHLAIRELSDAGTPVVAADPASAQAQAFLAVASATMAALDGSTAKAAPVIEMVD